MIGLATSGALRLARQVPTAGVTIFGILNVTEDSFSDGGRFLEPAAALEHALTLVEDGADVIDVGAASSHPEAKEVGADEEIRRLAPVLDALGRRRIAFSVDSWRGEVQRFALARGAAFLNDIRGFGDAAFYGELARAQAGLVLMHSLTGGPRATREAAGADDVLRAIYEFFDARVAALEAAGIARSRLVLDPGMGLFLGTDIEASATVLRRLGDLRGRYGCDVMVSVSRKSVVAGLARREGSSAIGVAEREAATLSAELFAVGRGATFIRTHEPRQLRDALTVWNALED